MTDAGRVLGAYELFEPVARGGVATLHLARHSGSAGFRRVVAIKRLHGDLARDGEFVRMFIDEGRVAARLRHPNVVPVIDVVQAEDEVFLVMEFVVGETLARLARREPVDPAIACALAIGVLHGLHAAHELTGDDGAPLDVVHRDVSPQNVVVGTDGVPRLLDFGIAKSRARLQVTREGEVKGKLRYMAPEQIGGEATRAADVYATSVVLWELLTGQQLIGGESDAEQIARVLVGPDHPPPSELTPSVTHALDALVLRGLARDPNARFATARDMARALERVARVAPASEVGDWVERRAGERIEMVAARIAEIERGAAPEPATTTAPTVATMRDTMREPRPRQRGFARAGMVALAVLLLGGTVAWRFARIERARALAPSASTVPGAAVEPSAHMPGPPVPTTAPEPPALASAPPTTASPSASAGPAAPSSASPPSSSARATWRGPWSAPPPPKAQPQCEPPYTVDDDGHRHFKRECFSP